MKWLAMLTLLLAAQASAHHGWSEYDARQPMNLSGTIEQSGYVHPHGFVRLKTDGKTWLVVLAPIRLENRGIAGDAGKGNQRRRVRATNRNKPDELRGTHHDRPEDDGTALMESAAGILGWLAATELARSMRGSLWMYPIVEIVHIVGIVLLVGSVAMFDLRVLGFARSLPLRTLGRYLLPWSVAGLALIVPAGLMMFSAHPHDFVGNKVFQLKLSLIGVAGINALLFHMGVYRSVQSWNTGVPAPALAQVQALASLAIWIAVISCGRLLAYT
jgi:hypothetical protein